MTDVFERLKNAGAGMGTRDPNDYSFMVSVAEAVLVGRRLADLEATLRSIRPYFADHSGEAIRIDATLAARPLDAV